MPTEVKLWQIEDDKPQPIPQDTLDLESRLENWIRDDIGLVNDGLLVIGQQIETDYGGVVDLLAIDSLGNLVILELKKDRTPRDIVAQTLDYASWVQGLGLEEVERLTSDFFNEEKALEQAFQEKFDSTLPEIVNEGHRMYVVASSLDSATERIIEYLSETHGVDINAATFAYFQAPGGAEMIGRSMLLDEQTVQTRSETRRTTKRRRSATQDELREIARENDVVELWDRVLAEIRPMVNSATRSQSTISLNIANQSMLSIVPGFSSVDNGLVLRLRDNIIAEHFGVSEDEILYVCGPAVETRPGWSWEGERFFDDERLDRFIELLRNANSRVAD